MEMYNLTNQKANETVHLRQFSATFYWYSIFLCLYPWKQMNISVP